MTEEKPDIHVLATGGTIANPPSVDGYVTGEELIANVPEASSVASLTVEDVAAVGSSSITVDIWHRLHDRLQDCSQRPSPPDGIVVTHGSNTMEETAYFLNLTLDTDIPVVLTAAQRNHDTIGNDGDRNLVDAIQVAGHPDARGRGVLVCVNDQIHFSRDVTKTASGRPDAWTSGDFGPVGLIDKYEILRFYYTPDKQHTTETVFSGDGDPADFPNVQVIYSAVDVDGSVAECAVDTGADGLVLAALPTGRPARPEGKRGQNQTLEEIAEELPVVISSRGLDGWPGRSVLEHENFVWGETLTPQKARILLALALQRTSDSDEIQSYFEQY
jgi:L-asparaginase